MDTTYTAADGSRYPGRYFAGLTKPQQRARERELAARKKGDVSFPKATDRAAPVRQSSWTEAYHKRHGATAFDLGVLSHRHMIPRVILKAVHDRGMRAWQTSGSRPGASAAAWARARVYKFLVIASGQRKMRSNDPDADQHRLIAK